MNNNLSTDIKEVMRESARELVEIMLLDNQEFRLIIWNNNNWDKPLPESIMKSFKDQLILDIKEMALDDSYVDEATGELILVSSFGGEEYSKVLEYDEIIAVLDLSGQPYIINNFSQEEQEEDIVYEKIPLTKNDWIDMATDGGIPRENAERSINAFIANNEWLREKVGE